MNYYNLHSKFNVIGMVTELHKISLKGSKNCSLNKTENSKLIFGLF